jgi:hypothetical protein
MDINLGKIGIKIKQKAVKKSKEEIEFRYSV